MKKLGLILMTLIVAVGCACTMTKASDAVKEYLGKYNNQDEEVMVELDALVEEENLSDEQSEKYKEIMKKQYTDLKYEIVNETYNGDEAIVTTKITVYDLYKVQQEATKYKEEHEDEFKDENKIYTPYTYFIYTLVHDKTSPYSFNESMKMEGTNVLQYGDYIFKNSNLKLSDDIIYIITKDEKNYKFKRNGRFYVFYK